MPIALPLSLTSHISAMVPAPTACTEAAAPPPSILITMSIPIDVETAETMFQIVKSAKDVR